MKIALVTCQKLPEVDVDEKLLVSALKRRGAEVRLLAWDDESAKPAPNELLVIRSTWNYFEHVDRFLAWVDRASATNRLFNPATIVRNNAKKTYLGDLESEQGIAIVPTEFAKQGAPVSIQAITQRRAWDAIVIKPTVSAGSFLTKRFEKHELAEAQAFAAELTAQRDAMIQIWMPAVNTYGERSLVWIAGEITHAIRKSPRFIGGHEAVSDAVEIAADERAFAEKILAPIARDVLYARVDMIRDDGGETTLRLMELELIEPSLFLKQAPRALERFADAIVAKAKESA